MNLSTICRRGAQVPALCGLFLALLIVAGCGPKAPPPAPSKPKTEAPKMNAGPVAQTNLSDQYTSVFEDLPPQKGKDPFFPAFALHKRPQSIKMDVGDIQIEGLLRPHSR